MKNKSILLTTKLMIVLLMGILISSFLNGCEEDLISPIVSDARLQITNASPNSPNFDVRLNNSTIASNFSYLSSTSYRTIPGDAVSRVVIYPAGGSVALMDTAIYCQQNKSYSFFTYDSLHKMKPLILTDDLTSPGTLNSSVRVVHLSPNTPALSVGGVGKASAWFPFYSFPQASPFRPITGGVYTVYANLAGTSTTVVTLPNVDLAPGRIYTILVRGFMDASGDQALGLTVISNN